MVERLLKAKAFQYLWRRASPDDAARVSTLKLPGVGVLSEQRRYYPNRELGAHVLGFASLDNLGLGGIESTYNSRISGRPGRVLLQTDAKAQAYGRIERPPTAGATLELTLDRDLQYIAERELAAGVNEFGAAGGTAIILEPKSGDVLALANWPTFNPNRFQDVDASRQRNRAIQEVYEPGSTFKIVTASAALEHGLVRLDEPFDTSLGYIRFGSRQIDDTHRYGSLTFTQVLVKSSNVGAIKIGLRVGPQRLVDYARRFGFGDAVAKDLPGQSGGILWPADKLNDSALASVSMGYQVGVTPIQMVAAVNAIASGGELIEPRLVRAVIEGNQRVERPTKIIRRAVKRETAASLTTIMEEVVQEGTAKAARMDGFTVAGKTGTAGKIENGRYSNVDYNASFVGFVPSREPAVTILVVIDSPRGKAGYYGGAVAAPIFKRIAEATLRHLGVAPNVDPAGRMLVVRREAIETDQPVPSPVKSSVSQAPRPVLAAGLMPDLRGVSARDAVRVLAQLGVAARLFGDGVVVDQQIAPGAPLEAGVSCIIHLSRQALVLQEQRALP
jgi:cell division protein FtsI (penicillin-binding protein 3)